MLNARQFYALSEPDPRRWPGMPTWLYLPVVVILALLCVAGSQIIGGFAMYLVFDFNIIHDSLDVLADPYKFTAFLLFSFLPVFLLTHWCLQLLERRGISTLGLQINSRTLKEIAIGLGAGLLMFTFAIIVMISLGYADQENPLGGPAAMFGALLVFFGFLVQGAAEEVLLRGFILQIFGRMTSTWFAILFSSVLFAFIHGANDSIDILPLINLCLFSVFAALYTLKGASLWGICAIHGIWNWAQGNLFGMQVSGNDVTTAIVFDLKETGPDIWTGGTFGPEGGLIVSGLLVICILLFRVRKPEPVKKIG